MSKYNTHPLALNDKEEKKLQRVIKNHKVGVKKIFMTMVNSLDSVEETVTDTPSENSLPQED